MYKNKTFRLDNRENRKQHVGKNNDFYNYL